MNKDEAICLYDKIFNQTTGCCAKLGTKSSNSKSIITHYRSKHGIDVDEYLREQSEKAQQSMSSFLKEKKFTEIWTLNSVVAKLVAVNFIKINAIATSFEIQKLLSREFGMTLSNFRDIRAAVINHSEEIRTLIKSEIAAGLEKNEQVMISFDEWTSGGNVQFINLIVFQAKNSFNLGLINVVDAANSNNLLKYIRERLEHFDIPFDKVKFLIADGASVNSKIAKMANLHTHRCYNHGIQLAIMDTLYEMRQLAEESIQEESDEEADDLNDDVTIPQETPAYEDLSMKFSDLVGKVRSLSKTLRKTNSEKVLFRYTHAKMLLDCSTRWTSLSTMIERFLFNCQNNAVQKACIDLHLKFDFTPEDLESLAEIDDIVFAATEIIYKLSYAEANLNTADLAVSEAITKLEFGSSFLRTQFPSSIRKRFLQRRSDVSDVLAYFLAKRVNQEGNLFYNKPTNETIKKYIKLFNPELLQQSKLSQQFQSINAAESSMNVDLDDNYAPNGDIDSAIALFDTTGIYGCLKPFVVNLMAIRPTSTDNERSFSIAGMIITPRSQSMKVDLVDANLIINRFYRNGK